jgi:hypothetical protein
MRDGVFGRDYEGLHAIDGLLVLLGSFFLVSNLHPAIDLVCSILFFSCSSSNDVLKPMETYTRVHVENSKTVTLEIVEIKRNWKIKLTSQEKAGKCSTTVGLHADSLEKAKDLADGLLANEHACDGRCGKWERAVAGHRRPFETR